MYLNLYPFLLSLTVTVCVALLMHFSATPAVK